MSDQRKERLMKLRAQMQKRRPKFIRENYYRYKRIQTSWRSPKGIDSKMRHRLKGKRTIPQTGYRGPAMTRGLHPSGKEIVQVFNVADLEKVDVETQIAQIGATVGSRKRMQIIDKAEDKEIHIINPQIRRLEDFEDEEFVELEDEFEELDDDLDLLDDDDLDDDLDDDEFEEEDED